MLFFCSFGNSRSLPIEIYKLKPFGSYYYISIYMIWLNHTEARACMDVILSMKAKGIALGYQNYMWTWSNKARYIQLNIKTKIEHATQCKYAVCEGIEIEEGRVIEERREMGGRNYKLSWHFRHDRIIKEGHIVDCVNDGVKDEPPLLTHFPCHTVIFLLLSPFSQSASLF